MLPEVAVVCALDGFVVPAPSDAVAERLVLFVVPDELAETLPDEERSVACEDRPLVDED